MSQKTNPTALRLQKNNQNFPCPGFSDFFFTENYHYLFEIENYVSAFLRQTQYSKAFFSAKNQYRNCSAWLFVQDSRADKTEKQSFLKHKPFKQDAFLKNYSKLNVFQQFKNSKQKDELFYGSKQKESKDLLSSWPESFASSFCADAGLRSSFAVLLQNKSSARTRDRFCLLSPPKLSFYANKLEGNGLPLVNKVLSSNLKGESMQKNSKKRKTKSKEDKQEWVRKNYHIVSLLFLCSTNAIKKNCQHLFCTLEDKIYNHKENVFLLFCCLLKGSFRKFALNDFLRLKQCKNFYKKTKQPKQALDKLKLRPKHLKQLNLKNTVSFIECSSLAREIMPTLYRSNVSAQSFVGFYRCAHFSFAAMKAHKATETSEIDKTKQVQKISNTRYWKNTFVLNYRLKQLCSIVDFTRQNHESRNIEFILQQQNHTQLKLPALVDFQPIRFIKDQQNVMSLLNQIVILLEKRVPFRQIKSFVSKDFSNLSKHFHLKGLRIACSGRLGGRSKKAQKAKMQCVSFGQTSLSAFSSKLIFASQSAHTPSGLIGVKLWLCFKTTRV